MEKVRLGPSADSSVFVDCVSRANNFFKFGYKRVLLSTTKKRKQLNPVSCDQETTSLKHDHRTAHLFPRQLVD